MISEISETGPLSQKLGTLRFYINLPNFWLGLKIKKKERRKDIPENSKKVPDMLT